MNRGLTYLLLLFCFCESYAQVEQKEVLLLMGSRFEINIVAEDTATANRGIHLAKAEIRRIEQLISSWDANSETSRINANAGIKAVKVSKELFQLIERSKNISELTHGAFDISAVVISQLWNFDAEMEQIPEASKIKALKSRINHQNIVLNKEDNSVFLTEKGMRIGFGSIGKGYAAQKAADSLRYKGFNDGLINAGGDLYAWGTQSNGRPWQVGITDPGNKRKAKSWLSIRDQAIVTSGDYEKRTLINGKYYSHIIDPRTAMPVENNLKSVSVLAQNAEMADALATALFVLGVETGLYLVNHLPQVEALFITSENEILTSNHIQLHTIEQ